MPTDEADAPLWELRMSFAATVAAAGRWAHQLDRDNRWVGSLPIGEAASRDVPFCVEVDPPILAVDFDDDRAEVAAAQLYLWLRSRGVLPVLVSSGATGRRHLLCRPGQLHGSAAEQARSMGGDVRRHIRPPLARHRSGARGELLVPSDPDEALARLEGDGLAQPLTPITLQRVSATAPWAEDRSVAISQVATGLANRGWIEEEFELLLDTPGSGAHQMYQDRAADRGSSRTREWAMTQVWRRATAFVRASPARGDQDPLHLGVLVSYALSRPWDGRSGPATRAVFLALAKVYERCATMPFNASHRELSELSGLGSRRTVQAALGVLVDHERLVRRHPGPIGAATAEVGLTSTCSFNLELLEHWVTPDPDQHVVLEHVDHDLFRHGELGKTAQLVFDAVLVCGGSARAIAERTGVSERTTRRHLRTLTEHGLVVRGDQSTWRTTGTTLDEAAAWRGTPARAAAQRERHQRERAAFRAHRESRTPPRSDAS